MPPGSGRSLPLIVALFALVIVIIGLVVTNLNGQANRSPESTPITTAISQLATDTSMPETAATDLPTQTLAPSPTSLPTTALPTLTASPSPPTATPTLTPIPPSATPTPTATGPTPLPPGFPTAVHATLRISEQRFERGRMMWRQGYSYIWVLWYTTARSGSWAAYQDTYISTEPWSDPNIVPPAGRYQPERGFGKLWRESPNLRDQLGWAITEELYYNAQYTYYAGGSIDASGSYVRGPGYHLLDYPGGDTLRLNENQTWELVD